MSEKRNIVLITLDSVRADHCSFMGYHRETTPTIDRMARRGLYFENAIASSVPTGPSMFGVFTGNYCPIASDDFSSKRWRDEFRRKTLAEVLSQMGYDTGAFHANPYVSSFFGFSKGFKYFNDFVKRDEIRTLTTSKISLLVSLKRLLKKEGSNFPWGKYYDRILEWVENANRPYFLWVLLLDTHTPYLPPKRYKKWCEVSNWQLIYLFWKIQRRNWKCGDKKEIEKVKDIYDDAIHYADIFIKRLWQDLKDDDPIFIIHADHGDGFGEHGFYRHPPLLYEEFIHVPLVIYNADAKGRTDKPVSLLGLAPTILELIGEENEFPSESFLHGGRDWVISKVFEGGKRKVAVRMKDWKFITGQKEEDELYYLKKDPYEQENVINEHPELAKEMRRIVEIHVKHEMKMRKIRKRVGSLRKL